MALEKIRLGTPPDGKDGDDGRTAFTRINDNFALMDRIGLTAEIQRTTADFNQATEPGWYYDANNTAANKPTLSYPVVHVVVRPGGFIMQEATSILDGLRSTRYLNANSGAWSRWLNTPSPGNVRFTSNLNDLAGITGSFGFNDDAANRPPNIAYGVVQTFSRSSNEAIQSALQVNGFAQARRNYIGGSWTEWIDTTPPGINSNWVGYGPPTRNPGNWYSTTKSRSRCINIFGGPAPSAYSGYRIITYNGADIRGNYSGVAGTYITAYAHIPAGTQYQVQHTDPNNPAAIQIWMELDL